MPTVYRRVAYWALLVALFPLILIHGILVPPPPGRRGAAPGLGGSFGPRQRMTRVVTLGLIGWYVGNTLWDLFKAHQNSLHGLLSDISDYRRIPELLGLPLNIAHQFNLPFWLDWAVPTAVLLFFLGAFAPSFIVNFDLRGLLWRATIGNPLQRLPDDDRSESGM